MNATALRNHATRLLSRGLEIVERFGWDTTNRPLEHCPVFILGAPRSGTTLLYQCLVQRYQVGYFANIHQRFVHSPALIERWLRTTRRPSVVDDFQSQQGGTKGWASPSENGGYWYRFFPRHPQHASLGDVPAAKLAALRGSMRSFINACDRPVVIKNLPCAVRLGPLHQCLPEALYIVIRRDELATAQSILHHRMKRFGRYDRWWSVETSNFEELQRQQPHEQVAEQIREIYRTIQDASSRLGQSRIYEVDYEEICADTLGALEAIERFLANHNVQLAVRGNVPASFAPRPGPPVDDNLLIKLQQYCDSTSSAPRISTGRS